MKNREVLPAARGVYAIRCITTGECYVGSSRNMRTRCGHHVYTLRRGKHGNPRLQRLWNKRGEDAFEVAALELIPEPKPLHVREQHWIDEIGTLNVMPGAAGNPGVEYCLTDDQYDRVLARVYDREVIEEWATIELCEEWKAKKRLLPRSYVDHADRVAALAEWNAALAQKKKEIAVRLEAKGESK